VRKRIHTLSGSALLAITASMLTLSACTVSLDHGGANRVSRQFHRIVPAAGVQRITIANVSGTIAVRGSNRSDVEINAQIHAPDAAALKKIGVNVERNSDTLRVKTQYPSTFLNLGSGVSGSVTYQILVPQRLAVNATNVDGSVRIAGVAGDVGAASISGDISAAANGGSLALKTTSGAIDGSVRTLNRSTRVSAASVSGDVSIGIPKNSGASVSAHSVSGSFSSNLALPKPNETIGTNLNAMLNGGGAAISFSTVSGAMSLTGR